MSRIIKFDNCVACPFYSTENNVYRDGTVGYTSNCQMQGKEIDFTDKMDVTNLFEVVHKDCPLEKY